ncbi:MAG TPA: serine/threonine-protein kinase [Nannocystaceae bacterium]|nr:serine/threonine-protein kinase [Nannocystaceae bacterium]
MASDDRGGRVASTDVLSPGPSDALASQTEHDEPGSKPKHELERGTTVGRYVVLERIGAGNMGVVYRAFDPELDRRVAIKLMAVRGTAKKRTAEVRARLLREAQALARVGHPNVIQVFDIGEAPGGVFVAMEYVDGLTLRQWSAERIRSWQEVRELFRQAARGLYAAHRADVVHRDFKPDNVMIGRDAGGKHGVGRVRVLDFGLARAATPTMDSHAREEVELGEPRQQLGFDEELTQHGTIVGTPAYMAPELHVGGVAGPSSDQFAFCVALWEALYGQRPFAGDTHAAIAFTIVQGKIRPPPTDRKVPRWLHAIAAKGILREPEQRFASMGEVLAALDGGRGRRRGLVIALGGVACAGALAYGLSRSHAASEPCGGAEQRIETLWSADRRAAIAEVFAGSSFAFAPETWTAAERVLDEWANGWVAAHTEACRATRVTGEQSEALMDLRIACLDRELRGFGALLDLFEGGEREAIIGAVDGARTLDDLAECSDTASLSSRTPLPSDPETRERIASLEAELAAIDARVGAGAYAGIAVRLGELRTRVLEVGWAPLVSRTMSLLATVELETGATSDALMHWEEAFREALVADERRRASFLAGKLAYAYANRRADLERARSWAALARALLRTFEDDGRTEASITSAESSIAIAAGDYSTAIGYDERLREFWSVHDPDSPELGIALGNLGSLRRITGDHEQAVELGREELRITKAAYGAAHPTTAVSMRHLALALAELHDYAEARSLIEQALAIHRAAQGERNVEVATALDELGRILRRSGELEAAAQRHREALAIWREELGEDHPDVGISMTNIAYTLMAQKKLDEALVLLTDARALHQRVQGADHPSSIYLGNAGGEVLLGLGRPAEAKQWVERGLASKAVAQVDPTLVAESKFVLARALEAGEPPEHARALQLADEARTTYAPHHDRFAEQIADIDRWLAQHRD